MKYARVVFWGTYDLSKPRTRILLEALRERGLDIIEIHADVWRGEKDKSQVGGLWRKLGFALRWLGAYPGLIWRYLRAPPHDAVVIGYLGQLDVLVLWPFARLRRSPLVWDMFISLYDTVIRDRAMFPARHSVAFALRAWEWLGCRAARIVVIDTAAHARLVQTLYGVAPTRTGVVYVGAELDTFTWADDAAPQAPAAPTRVLFYGQFIPLHGIEVIVRAAAIGRALPLRWTLIGQGQEAPRIRTLIGQLGLAESLEWIDWVPYESLPERIAAADVCLGIFGGSDKAANVIPNKVFQILAVGRPLVTRDSPAIRELIEDHTPGVKLVPADHPQALLDAVMALRTEHLPRPPRALREHSSSAAIGATLIEVLWRADRS